MTTMKHKEENLTIEQAQELITNKQADIMQETELFVDHIIILQDDENKNMIVQDDQNQADILLENI